MFFVGGPVWGTLTCGRVYVCVPIRLGWGRSGGNECDSSLRRWERREGPQEIEQGSGVMRDSAPRSSDGMAPPSDGGPSEAESQNRRIPPTPVCRDEVGLTSWLGKPLHLPARREQVWVLRLTLEFRMLPCIRGCRLTGLVTSRISRSVGGKEPPGEKEAKMILQDAGRD